MKGGKNKYIKPCIEIIGLNEKEKMLAGSGHNSQTDNTLYHSDTQTNTSGPGTGGDVVSDGEITDAAKHITLWEYEW